MSNFDKLKQTIAMWQKCVDEADTSHTKDDYEHNVRRAKRALLDAIIKDISVDRLEEICEAEREGRCVVLPCKVGDRLYFPTNKGICKCAITKIDLNGIALDNDKGAWIFLKHLNDKTVFLTKAEAEQALSKLNGKEGK